MKKSATRALVIALFPLIGLAIFGLAGCRRSQTVRVTEVKLSDLHSSINTNGKVEPEQVFELRAPFSGLCQEILVREGDPVRKGQTLLKLENASLQSELAAAKAELASAEVDLKNVERGPVLEELNQAQAEVSRLRAEVDSSRKVLETSEWLLQKNAIARFEVEEGRRALARVQKALEAAILREEDLRKKYDEVDRRRVATRLSAAKARVQFLENSLALSVLRAPATGTLYHFEVKNGAYLQTGDLVGIVADLRHLRVRAFVDEPELGRITLGEDVLVRWDGRPRDSWKGTVSHIPSQVVARGSRSVAEVLCAISSPQQTLIPNVNVDVEIITARGARAPSLPRNCVFPEGKNQFVWIVQDGQAVKRKVETGRSSPSIIEVTGGLAVGDRVIVPGEFPLTEGLKIRVGE